MGEGEIGLGQMSFLKEKRKLVATEQNSEVSDNFHCDYNFSLIKFEFINLYHLNCYKT